jgi:RNA recognition motif-containing protein
MTRLVISNLSPRTTTASVDRLFASFGTVRSVHLATDVMTGRCGGFGYVCLDEAEPGAAVVALHGSPIDGRALRVVLEQKGESFASAARERRRVYLPTPL